jgi:RNA polymerase sigma-70 factor (ECF subfamily)
VEINERELAKRAARRDGVAFAKLYKLYNDKIYRYIYYKSGRTDEAEDMTAQVFFKAWHAIPHYRWKGHPFSTWLYRIAHNRVIDHYRTYRETLPLETAFAQLTSADPIEIADRFFTGAKIRAALRRLTRDQERVITLRFLDGYSTAEVAAMLDKDPDAIRALQFRGLRVLRSYLKGEGQLRRISRNQVAQRA